MNVKDYMESNTDLIFDPNRNVYKSHTPLPEHQKEEFVYLWNIAREIVDVTYTRVKEENEGVDKRHLEVYAEDFEETFRSRRSFYYTELEEVGKGCYGYVIRLKEKPTMCVKFFAYWQGIETMSLLDKVNGNDLFPNVYAFERDTFCIVEYLECNGVTLDSLVIDYLESGGGDPKDIISDFFDKLFIEYLQGVFITDLHSGNIMLVNNQLKIIDLDYHKYNMEWFYKPFNYFRFEFTHLPYMEEFEEVYIKVINYFDSIIKEKCEIYGFEYETYKEEVSKVIL